MKRENLRSSGKHCIEESIIIRSYHMHVLCIGEKKRMSKTFYNIFTFILIQWTLIITNSLGPVKLLCYVEMLLYPGCKNNKIQRNVELWDQENYFVISGFCYISVLYNESPLY